MDNISQLFIRACKSQDSLTRLRSVYKRFYGNYGTITNDVAIGDLLTHLVDEIAPMKVSEYLREVSSYKSFNQVINMMRKKGEDESHTPDYLVTLYIMRDKLRGLKKKQLIGLGCSVPRRFIKN